MKRFWTALGVVLLAIPVLVSAPVAPTAAASTAVDVVPDYAKKTITITVRLAFYLQTVRGTPMAGTKTVADALAAIRNDILAFWGKQKFLCFDIIVKPEIRLATGPDDVHADEVAIRLDLAPVPIKGSTAKPPDARVAAGGTENYLSEDPADSARPATGPPQEDDPTISNWPTGAASGVYAHEFGHVLGLDDNYESVPASAESFTLRPGAADDLMFLQGKPVDATTITRMIRRSGAVDESRMKCSMTAELAPAAFGLTGIGAGTVALHMYTCKLEPPSNGPAALRPMKFDGTTTVSGGGFTEEGVHSGTATYPVTTSVLPGDPLFTMIYQRGKARIEVNQRLDWTQGRPMATFTQATLTQVLPLPQRVLFTDGAKECP